jgi:hypothetical protein
MRNPARLAEAVDPPSAIAELQGHRGPVDAAARHGWLRCHLSSPNPAMQVKGEASANIPRQSFSRFHRALAVFSLQSYLAGSPHGAGSHEARRSR